MATTPDREPMTARDLRDACEALLARVEEQFGNPSNDSIADLVREGQAMRASRETGVQLPTPRAVRDGWILLLGEQVEDERRMSVDERAEFARSLHARALGQGDAEDARPVLRLVRGGLAADTPNG